MADFPILSNEIINTLLTCEKVIVSNPSPKNKSNGMHKETGISLESTDGTYRFTVFVREHTQLMETFSVGLVYNPDTETSVILARYNGDHVHKNQLTGEVFRGFHIHKATEESLNAGFKVENHATRTEDYTNVTDALTKFFNDMNVRNYLDYYPELQQIKLL